MRSNRNRRVSFNGAAPGWARRAGGAWLKLPADELLQRSRARLGAESPEGTAPDGAPQAASTEPRPVGRGEQPQRCPIPSSTCGFNGAAPGWARRGKVRTARPARTQCFNGAAPGWARRAASIAPAARRRAKLQRSRARLGAERVPAWWAIPKRAPASTEPRPVGRGERSPQQRNFLSSSSFNGAAPGWARRGKVIGDSHDPTCGFNGAAPGWARREYSGPVPPDAVTVLQRSRARLGAESLQSLFG